MLIACKTGINYSKRDSSMMEFAAIDERKEVQASIELIVALQSGLMKGN